MENSSEIKKYAASLERASWILLFFSLMTQVSIGITYPSYNIALAFWGCYTSFTKHGRACFGLLAFLFLSLILDIVFCSINKVSISFTLVMFIICMISKVYCLHVSSHFFAAIGGAYSMESSVTSSAYDSFINNSAGYVGGYYNNMSNSNVNNPLSSGTLDTEPMIQK